MLLDYARYSLAGRNRCDPLNRPGLVDAYSLIGGCTLGNRAGMDFGYLLGSLRQLQVV